MMGAAAQYRAAMAAGQPFHYHPEPTHGRGLARGSWSIIDAAHDILEEIQPATVRAVCYRLFAAGLIPNMGKTATGKVSRLLVYARESDVIPWDWIVDETRSPETVASWDNPEQIIRAAVHGYRKDYWADQPEWVEVWSEKGTVRGTIARVLHELGVTFRVMHGYGSATSIHGAAEDSMKGDKLKLLTVLYVGDWDPSGLHMSEVDLPARIERYGGAVMLERIALAAEDVGDDLPHFDVATKAKDPRFQWYAKRYGSRCWELDALSPVILRDRVREAITERLDLTKWNRCVQVEKAERESMADFLDTWHRTISLPVSKYPEGQP